MVSRFFFCCSITNNISIRIESNSVFNLLDTTHVRNARAHRQRSKNRAKKSGERDHNVAAPSIRKLVLISPPGLVILMVVYTIITNNSIPGLGSARSSCLLQDINSNEQPERSVVPDQHHNPASTECLSDTQYRSTKDRVRSKINPQNSIKPKKWRLEGERDTVTMAFNMDQINILLFSAATR